MTQIGVLGDLAIIAVLGVAVTVLLARLRLPTVAGLLAAGALLGPYGLRLVGDVRAIEAMAEVGVVLLLFTIGLEFSISRLGRVFRKAALGGATQVVATTAATAGVAMALGQTPQRAVFYGFVMAMSSTAIVLRALGDRGELDAPHGRFVVGTMIFQDLCVVPMVLLVPVLGSGAPAGGVAVAMGIAGGKAVLVIAGALALARYVVPLVLGWVDASRSREAFLLAILAICVGTAWLTSLAGLSLALGAFLGGVVVAGTEFQHRAMGDMIPLRDAFVSVFFVSLGMLFDAGTVVAHPLEVGLLLAGFVLFKAAIATLSAIAVRSAPRAAWLSGVALGQFGEFGFVLIKLGESAGLVDEGKTGPILSAGIVSMFLTPLFIGVAPRITAGERLLAPLARMMGAGGEARITRLDMPEDHVIVIGYGIAGRTVGRALDACGIPHTVLEMNAGTVKQARERGEPVAYADATSPEALALAGIGAARMVVVLINDPEAARRVVVTARRVAGDVPIVVRTRYLADRERLMALGASEVVAEEVEASVEVVGRMLGRLGVGRERIEERVGIAREEAKGL